MMYVVDGNHLYFYSLNCSPSSSNWSIAITFILSVGLIELISYQTDTISILATYGITINNIHHPLHFPPCNTTK